MGRRTVTQFANQIKRLLSPTVHNDLGRRVGFCHRERLITPYRLGLLASHATGTVETLADIQRQFNALLGPFQIRRVNGDVPVRWRRRSALADASPCCRAGAMIPGRHPPRAPGSRPRESFRADGREAPP